MKVKVNWDTTDEARLIYPRRYQYNSRRQYVLALRRWRVWNKRRLNELPRC